MLETLPAERSSALLPDALLYLGIAQAKPAEPARTGPRGGRRRRNRLKQLMGRTSSSRFPRHSGECSLYEPTGCQATARMPFCVRCVTVR